MMTSTNRLVSGIVYMVLSQRLHVTEIVVLYLMGYMLVRQVGRDKSNLM